MEEMLSRAREILEKEGCTFVLCSHETIYKSTPRGIRPLVALLDGGPDVTGFYAADKVVGRAAAFVYCLLGVKAVFAPVMSEAAVEILRNHNIEPDWITLTPAIRNRAGDGLCPMETATQTSATPQKALEAIRGALAHLR